MIKVELTQKQWKDVLALMERGVTSIGYPAFVSGGELIRQVGEQTGLLEKVPNVTSDTTDTITAR